MASSARFKNASVSVRLRSNRVTGSSLEISINDNGIKAEYIIDKGLFLEPEMSIKNFDSEENYSKYSAMFLTHAHIDHSGLIPHCIKQGFNGPIYMSKPTLDIVQLLIQDEYLILKQQGYKITREDEKAIKQMALQTETCRLYEKVGFKNAEFTLIDNAHVLGSNSIYFKTVKSINNMHILVTGDYRPHHPFLQTKKVHQFIKHNPINVMFMESTYGKSDLHPDFNEAVINLKNEILCTISNGGDVLIPVFSFDRTQVILYVLNEIQKMYPEMQNIPIFLDGKLAYNITKVYNGSLSSFVPANIVYILSKDDRNLLYKTKNKIVLASSGQMHAGPVVSHITSMIENPKNTLISVGYIAHAMGKQILEAPQGEIINYFGKELVMNMKRVVIPGFSAHADKRQLADFVRLVKKHNPNLKLVLYHGEPDAKLFLKRYLEEEGIISGENVFIPTSEDEIIIDKHTLKNNQLLSN